MTHEPECMSNTIQFAPCNCYGLRVAYQRGREDERVEKAPVVLLSFRRPITDKQYRRIAAAVVAAGGTVNAHD